MSRTVAIHAALFVMAYCGFLAHFYWSERSIDVEKLPSYAAEARPLDDSQRQPHKSGAGGSVSRQLLSESKISTITQPRVQPQTRIAYESEVAQPPVSSETTYAGSDPSGFVELMSDPDPEIARIAREAYLSLQFPESR